MVVIVVVVMVVIVIVVVVIVVVMMLGQRFSLIILALCDSVPLLDTIDHLVEALQHRSSGFLVTTIHVVLRLDLRSQCLLKSELRHLLMSLRIVLKEKSLVGGILLDPLTLMRVSHHFSVSVGLEVLGTVTERQLLKISIVEDVRVHTPARVETLLGMANET